MLMLALDLEMAQPSQKIIQIGAVIGNIKTGQIKSTFSRYVNPNETLTQYIIDLTGITQEQVDNGTTLHGAYTELVLWKNSFKARNQVVAWGEGDTHLLRKQLSLSKADAEWEFGLRFFDVKTVYQSIMIAKGGATKAGLLKAMETYGLVFDGKQHDAEQDAKNTFILWHHLLGKLGTI